MSNPEINELLKDELLIELEKLKAKSEIQRKWHNKNMKTYYNKPEKKLIILQRAKDKYHNNLEYQAEVKLKRNLKNKEKRMLKKLESNQ